MSRDTYDIYVIGVGGQGIGLLSEVLVRAIDYAGRPGRSVDTHGLAQRGGTVISQIRMGAGAHSPLIQRGSADMVVALERHEALRAMNSHLADAGALVYYDAEWQPLSVRLGQAERVTAEMIASECQRRGITLTRVFLDDLDDARMQNVAVLGALAAGRLVPGIEPVHYEQAISDLMAGSMLESNLALFRSIAK